MRLKLFFGSAGQDSFLSRKRNKSYSRCAEARRLGGRTVSFRKGETAMKIAIYTLGCKVNQYETQAMERELLRRGHMQRQCELQHSVYEK